MHDRRAVSLGGADGACGKAGRKHVQDGGRDAEHAHAAIGEGDGPGTGGEWSHRSWEEMGELRGPS
jgi:hypothetical protein